MNQQQIEKDINKISWYQSWWMNNIVYPLLVFLIGTSLISFVVTSKDYSSRQTILNEAPKKWSTTTTVGLLGEINLDNLAKLTVVPALNILIQNKKWDPGYEIWLILGPTQKYSFHFDSATTSVSFPVTVSPYGGAKHYDFNTSVEHDSNEISVGGKIFVVTLLNINAVGGGNLLNYNYTFGINEK